MKNFLIVLVLTNFTKCNIYSAQSVGCPTNCLNNQACPNSECPYGGCVQGWWGRKCEHPLECLIPGDNGIHYRGTKNVTKDGVKCIKWNTPRSNFAQPPDEPDHSYCRHAPSDGTENTWCYTKISGDNHWDHCNVTLCDKQCPAPKLQPHSFVTKTPSNGFAVGVTIAVKCEVGYVMLSNCKPLECLIPGDNGVHYRGTKDVTMGGKPCLKWKTGGSRTPPDGSDHNFCRHAIDDSEPNTWCYATNAGHVNWGTCNIPLCDDEDLRARGVCPKGFYHSTHPSTTQTSITCLSNKTWSKQPFPKCINTLCPAPILQPHSLVTNTPPNSYAVGVTITVECEVGYGIQSACNPLECLIPGDNGIHYRGTKNVIIGGRTCINWNARSNPRTPPDGPDHNYCRHAIDDYTPNTWCYVSNNANDYWGKCDIPLCNDEDLRARGVCPKGFYHSTHPSTTQTSITCLSNKTWSKQPFLKCITKCKTPTEIPHSYITNRQELYFLNESLEVRCDEGYETTDNRYFKCLEGGSWNGTMPNCSVIHCLLPRLYNHSRFLSKSSNPEYNEKITIRCEDGYLAKGKNTTTLTCLKDKRWDASPPICNVIHCDRPPLNDNSIFINASSNPAYKENITIGCEPGYFIEGKTTSTLTCLKDKTWDFSPPKCKATCRRPRLRNSSIVNTQVSQTYKENDVLEIKCDTGYETKGQRYFVCQNDKLWNGTMPQCSIIHCDLPKHNNHSHIVRPKSNTLPAFNEVVIIGCDDGYYYEAEKITLNLTCRADKKWDKTPPICQEKPKQLADKSGSNVGAIGGGIGAVVVVIVIIVIIIVVIKRRTHGGKGDQMNSITIRTPKMEMDMYPASHHSEGNVYENENKSSATYANADSVNDAMYYDFSPGQSPTKNAIKVDAIAEYARRKVAERETLEADYETFKSGLQMSVDEAEKSRNRKKNKYRSIYPYDDNRVTLKMLPRQPDSDYINASYINGCGNFRKYIASQGPIKPSVDDFWRMIWELNIKKVVMLTNVFEEGKEKCVKYWPDEGNITFGETDITLEKEDIFCDYTIRELSIHKNGTRKDVVQYHFTAWPDKGVPKSGSTLITLRNLVFGGDLHQEIPTLVHCSAGIGRTGTFIALDFLIDQANITGFVDFYECVVTLRRQRVNMVQTKDQYVFLHEIIAEALVYSNTGVMSSEFADEYKSLIHKDKIRTLYETLQNTTPQIDEKEYKTGKAQANKRKNRLSNIIPVDSERPYISVDEEGGSYINAVFLPSTRDHRAFIVTQMPLQDTLTDFWKLIWEHDAQSIVMLNGTLDESTGTYWPSSGKPLTFGSFAVTLKETEKYKFGTASTLSVRHGKENRTVKLFKYGLWSDKSTVPEETLPLLDLIKIVLSDKQNGPIVVHCLNGVEKSGVYCTLANAVQQINDDQEIDIPKIIRRLRLSRPQIIPNLEQFRFCYDAVMEYLNQFSTYQNI